ncbi:MAG: hypothetical protein LQ338_007938 [Usnochroma carphineum]|nr:MAG: hypothetical protein LQ338_007938 [Usnochroma carphineum]
MDHVPYPLTSDLPALEIPLLGQPVPVHPLYSEGAAPSKLQKTEPDSLAIKSNHVDPITGEADLSTGDTQGSPRYPIVEASAQIPVQARQTTEDWTIAFWRYPKQHGWLSNDSKSRWFLCSEKEAAVRAQEWLYFRLLNEFLGVHVPAHTLSKPSTINGKIVVDSSTLPQLLHDWHLRIQQRGLGRKHDATEEYFSQDKAHRVISLLKSVLEECSNLDEQVEPFRSVSLSINILVETLAKAVWRITKDATAAQWKIWKLGPQPLLEERMARAGWCRFRISKIWYQYHPSTVYYLSSLPHRTTFGGYPHPACTADQCTFVGVDPVTYEPRHHKDCLTQSRCHRRCSMIGVNTAKIADIIIQGSIPLIEIQVQADDGVVLNVVPYKSSLRYVAISHVWSGGLGNVRANAMRSCQLRYLHNLLRHLRDNGDDDLDRRQGPRKIQDSVDDIRYKCGFERKRMPLYLWIDTLCVPIGPIHKEAYSKTLYRMAQLYVAAQCVLVLDPELQSIDHRVLQKEQTFTHIMCSSWMSRSWTFQEACMARIWFVQFADGYFTVDKQYFEFQKASGRLDQKEADVEAVISSPLPAVVDMSEPQIDLMHDVTHWFREMPVVAKIRNRDPRKLMNKLEDWKNLAFAWNGLRSRSTTKADDFYGIVAVVVDLSAGEVLKHQPEDRLKAILRSQTTLPLALLYQSGPRILDDKGYDTWAPARINGARLDVQSGYFTLRSSDLLLEPGQWPQLRAPQAILFTSLSTSSRLVNVEFDLTKTTRTIEFLLRPTSPLPDTPFSNVLCMFDDTLATILPGVGICAPGACLVIHSQEDMIYQASYLCPIRVFAPKTFTSYVDSSVSEKIEAEPAILSGSVLDWQKYSIVITSSGKC